MVPYQPVEKTAPGREHARDAAAGHASGAQLRHGAADVLRLQLGQVNVGVDAEQLAHAVLVTHHRGRAEAALVGDLLDKPGEQHEARVLAHFAGGGAMRDSPVVIFSSAAGRLKQSATTPHSQARPGA